MIKNKNVDNANHGEVVAILRKYQKKETIPFTVVAVARDPLNPDRGEKVKYLMDFQFPRADCDRLVFKSSIVPLSKNLFENPS